jgi:hypothetical protein
MFEFVVWLITLPFQLLGVALSIVFGVVGFVLSAIFAVLGTVLGLGQALVCVAAIVLVVWAFAKLLSNTTAVAG